MNFAKKSLGQNFLIDKNIVKKIIKCVSVKNRNVIEIGPGKGALTDEILKQKPKSLIIVEKDNNLYKKLKSKYIKEKTINIFNADILKFNLVSILKTNSIIFGNLPYNISSQILIKIIKLSKTSFEYSDLIFMFQKELGNKIIGKFPSRDYGRLSIFSNYKLNISHSFIVSPNCFSPKPKVNSMVIHFKMKKNIPYKIKSLDNLEKITNIIFSNKRKMINKNIKKILNEEQLKLLNINLNLRPGEINPKIYYKITELLETTK